MHLGRNSELALALAGAHITNRKSMPRRDQTCAAADLA